MPIVVNARPMIKNAANPTKDGAHGLKHLLRNLPQKPKDEVNHNAALFSLDRPKENIPFNQQPNKDETLEEKREQKEQNPNTNTGNFQDTHLTMAFQRRQKMQQNLKDFKKEGFELKAEQKEQLLKRAFFSPVSGNPDDPMGLKKVTQRDKKIVDIILSQKLSAEQIVSLLEKHTCTIKLPDFGKINNKRPDLRKATLLREIRKNNQIRENIQHQVDIEKEKPKLFTNAAAAGVKNALSDR